jgi:hypothetical protein
MPTFNEEAQRIKQELDTIETVLRAELKKTLIGRWLAKVVLDKNWQRAFQWRHTHKREKDPVLQMFEHEEMGE